MYVLLTTKAQAVDKIWVWDIGLNEYIPMSHYLVNESDFEIRYCPLLLKHPVDINDAFDENAIYLKIMWSFSASLQLF